MPTYAYLCKDCGHAFDIQQSFTEDSLTACPQCEGALRKKFNSVGVVFKGSGFYRTDSRAAATASDSSNSSGNGSSGNGASGNGSAGNGASDKGSDSKRSSDSKSSEGSGSSKPAEKAKTPATAGSSVG